MLKCFVTVLLCNLNTSLVLDCSFQAISGVQWQRPKQRMKKFMSSTHRHSLHLFLLAWCTLSNLAWWKLFFLHILFCHAMFWPFLNLFSLRSHHLGWGAQLCPAVGLLEWLQPALQRPLQPPYQHLGTCTRYNCFLSSGLSKKVGT